MWFIVRYLVYFIVRFLVYFIVRYLVLHTGSIFFNSFYSSMVERNTVNILINVRFILKAYINYAGQVIPAIMDKFN